MLGLNCVFEFLGGYMAVNADGQPVEIGFNFSNNAVKAVNVLYGLCMGGCC